MKRDSYMKLLNAFRSYHFVEQEVDLEVFY
jgi:hypothetical protein